MRFADLEAKIASAEPRIQVKDMVSHVGSMRRVIHVRHIIDQPSCKVKSSSMSWRMQTVKASPEQTSASNIHRPCHASIARSQHTQPIFIVIAISCRVETAHGLLMTDEEAAKLVSLFQKIVLVGVQGSFPSEIVGPGTVSSIPFQPRFEDDRCGCCVIDLRLCVASKRLVVWFVFTTYGCQDRWRLSLK
nr:hypothetical protein CFP56_20932 [Quercus suber]